MNLAPWMGLATNALVSVSVKITSGGLSVKSVLMAIMTRRIVSIATVTLLVQNQVFVISPTEPVYVKRVSPDPDVTPAALLITVIPTASVSSHTNDLPVKDDSSAGIFQAAIATWMGP